VQPTNTSQLAAAVNVTTAANETVRTSLSGFRFPATITPTTITGHQKVWVNTTLPRHTAPETYTGALIVRNQTYDTQVPFNITVPAVPNWTLTPTNASFTIPVNTTRSVANLTVANTGNTDLTVDTRLREDSGEARDLSTVFDVRQRFQVFRGENRTQPLGASTAFEQQPGGYNGTLEVLVGDEVAQNISVEATVVDDVAPSATVTVNDTEATVPTELTAAVDDNVRIANVTGTVYRTVTDTVTVGNRTEVRTGNETIAEFQFGKEDAGAWSYEFTNTSALGDYHVTVTVTDASENTRTVQDSFTVDRLEAVAVPTQNPQAPAAKVNTWSTTELFTLTEPTPVRVSLAAFQYGAPANGTLGNATVQLVLPTGGKDFFEAENGTVQVSQPGTYRVRVKGGIKDVYNARFSVRPVIGQQHVPVDPIAVTGAFTRFAAQDDMRRQWAGADFIACSNTAEATILGEEYAWSPSNQVDKARYVCVIPFKSVHIGASFENEVVPVPPAVREKEQQVKDAAISHWRGLAEKRNIIMWVLGVLLIGSNVTWVTVIYLYPRLRFEFL
jgi:hypothetical protein